MENMARKGLFNGLAQGRDLAKQLRSILLEDPSMASVQIRELLVEEIIASFERSLVILQPTIVGREDNGSPNGQVSDGDFKDLDLRNESKKRKLLPRWTQKLQGCLTNGLEGHVEDGYNWRKYGQKDILGAKYPRGYYRCTHKQVQGCFATKQVQRSDDDPTIFDVTYRGKHTCTQASSSSIPNPKDRFETLTHHLHKQKSQEIFLSFQTDLKDIKPININNKFSSSCSFPSSSLTMAATLQAPTTMVHNNNLVDHHANLYQSSPRETMNNFIDPHAINQQGDDLVRDVPQVSLSTTNSPVIIPEFPFDHGEFDHEFFFDNLQFLL